MPTLYLRLTLETDVALTAESGTLGGHETLTYIPGAALLGAVAAALYPPTSTDRPPPDDAVRMFHSGAVRFGMARPAVDGMPALPMPLCLHSVKNQEGPLQNLAVNDRVAGTQYVQRREGGLTPDGALVQPTRRYSLRTSIGSDGRAREGFLYGIETLEAGTVLCARVDADDENDLRLAESALVGRTMRVGRSRSAELGKVRVEKAAPWSVPTLEGTTRRLVVLCLSDLALRDAMNGAPRTEFQPSDLGLPADWRVLPSHTFVRVRRYSPFNGTRRRPDLERQVIVAGSVITLAGDTPVDRAAIRANVARGLGDHRQDGLGELLIDPAALSKPEHVTHRWMPAAAPAAPIPDDALGRWLQRTTHDRRAEMSALAWAGDQARDLAKLRMATRAQWGEIRRQARAARRQGLSDEAFLRRVASFVTDGSATIVTRWGRKVRGETAAIHLIATLKAAQAKAPGDLAIRTEMLCAEVARRSQADREETR